MLVFRRNRSTSKITFCLPADEPAGEVSVVGDFNGWDPGAHRLTRSTYGTRAVSITLPRGRSYAFRYLAEGGQWFDEPDAEHTKSGNSILAT
jgi:1,4-alpha-glucan branching enzyme